jgi:hypothetical protein
LAKNPIPVPRLRPDLVNNPNGGNTDNFRLRDYTHASNTFLAKDGYSMVPKFGFLFHVRIVFNQPGQSQNGERSKTISVLCKSADLPKFNIDFEELNKYNKKEVIPKKLKYEAVNLSFHDDAKNTIRDMWLAYNTYYFADAGVTPEAWSLDDTYLENRPFNRYGLDNNQTVKFIKSVDIYSMGEHKYTKYSLINPLITSFDFDRYDYSDGAKTMETQLRLDYETVLYYEGNTESIPGFGKDNKAYYDNRFSTLGPTKANPSETAIEQIETAIAKTAPQKVIQPYLNEIKTMPVKISQDQVAAIRAVASNSVQNLRRFSFPTANEIKNVSSLVDLTGRNRFASQGRIATVGIVTSNGIQVNTAAPSSSGLQTTVTGDISNLIVNAIIPAGLTETEKQKFIQSYPPLSTTDSRTRLPPYV